jgi:putative hydrolase of HD superfamily
MTSEIKQLFNFLEISERLKTTKRFLNTKEMKQKESSADHSWNLALLTFMTAEELKLDIDILKAVKIALVHDLVEALAGDTDYSLIAFGIKTPAEKNENEISAMKIIEKVAPKESGQELVNLWQEYEKAETREARFVKALDKIEGINHMLCKGHKCFDHPELVAPYPNKAVQNFPELIPMLQELQKRLKPEFEKHGWEWKKEYEIKELKNG